MRSAPTGLEAAHRGQGGELRRASTCRRRVRGQPAVCETIHKVDCYASLFGMRLATASSDTCSPLVGMSGPMSLTTAAAMVGVNPPAALAGAQVNTESQ